MLSLGLFSSCRAGVGLGLSGLMLLSSSGCSIVGGAFEVQEQTEQLAGCRGSASDAEVEENILITQEYAKSLATDFTLSWNPVLFAIDFMILWGQTVAGVVSGSPMGWTIFDA